MILNMRSGRMSILVCAMTVLCPVLCMAELSAHQEAHDETPNASPPTHAHEGGDRPHHQHEPNGDPVPHGEHTCLCVGSTTPGSVLQVPSLEPAGVIGADDEFLTSLECNALADSFVAHGFTDPRSSARSAPLLI